ncbi:MAG: Crp/Fnr family transcriptional regulator [Bacteroidales bacterium]|nr:Crp/Fnr family transcriptional regulator [Bacteroidales bacterium]
MAEDLLLHRNCVDCELKCDIFKLLTREELELVNENRSVTHYKQGEIIFKQGAPNTHVIFLTSGIVKVYVEGYDSKELILAITKPTQFISGPELYVNNIYPYSAAALAETTTCYVNGEVFKQLVRQNVQFAEGFLKEFSRRSLNTIHNFVSLTQKKMPGRIAGGLLYLANSVFKLNEFELILSKQELGELTAMSKESAQRILKDLQDEGIIQIKNNYLEIKDLERLEKICECG